MKERRREMKTSREYEDMKGIKKGIKMRGKETERRIKRIKEETESGLLPGSQTFRRSCLGPLLSLSPARHPVSLFPKTGLGGDELEGVEMSEGLN
jgi:hypothetical protein